MVKHIILWNLKDEFSNEQKLEIMAQIKEGLEALKGKIDGLVEIKVQIEKLGFAHFLKKSIKMWGKPPN